MKQRDLFYCHAVFFVSADTLHTVLRVPSCLRLEGIFVFVLKSFGISVVLRANRKVEGACCSFVIFRANKIVRVKNIAQIEFFVRVVIVREKSFCSLHDFRTNKKVEAQM